MAQSAMQVISQKSGVCYSKLQIDHQTEKTMHSADHRSQIAP